MSDSKILQVLIVIPMARLLVEDHRYYNILLSFEKSILFNSIYLLCK